MNFQRSLKRLDTAGQVLQGQLDKGVLTEKEAQRLHLRVYADVLKKYKPNENIKHS